MTATLISLISILSGIIGANLMAVVFKKYSLGSIGNTIAGVFGSILFMKSFGRLGFDPFTIVESGNINFNLLILNLLISFLGGLVALILIKKLKILLNKN
ncbi:MULTISPECIES: hypothetical protein [Flavobacteriaceae]|uniref:GlsB/YeaQ/YmgE family stress response membrane protein n=2 Tax=Flavobacteriaceae TaxID=49546 RepID=A0A4Y8AQT3_9FLAO|nr:MULTISPECIES: hypothetical protein [Flavobacteriaceae]TEW72514.1 hypothetical protein E2488_13775 [Gramella jeungdoensis]GGK55102.1 hypothetical protein GCM10007963_24270 [Lutibacter litoralis]